MQIENIAKCRHLLEVRDNLQKASRMLEAQNARVTVVTPDGPIDLSDGSDKEFTYAVMDAIAARLEGVDKQIMTL